MAATKLVDPLTFIEDRIAYYRRVAAGQEEFGLSSEQLESVVSDLVEIHTYVADNIEAMAERELEHRLRTVLTRPTCGFYECMNRYKTIRSRVLRKRS